jgi:CheY-like chemotaxis protein
VEEIMEATMAKILIVDDEEMDRVFESTILESAGHEVYYAHDGNAALKILEEMTIDLVITDLAMPEFNGLRFIRELREDGVEIPVIAVSGWASDQLDLAEDYGANLTLFKPLDGEALAQAVERMLEEVSPAKKDPWRRGQ